MRKWLFCLLIVALDAAFALSGTKTFVVPALSENWAGVPVSVWAGIAGLAFLVLLTFAISRIAFKSEAQLTQGPTA